MNTILKLRDDLLNQSLVVYEEGTNLSKEAKRRSNELSNRAKRTTGL